MRGIADQGSAGAADAEAAALEAAHTHWAIKRQVPPHINVNAAMMARLKEAPSATPCCYLEQEGLTLLWPFAGWVPRSSRRIY